MGRPLLLLFVLALSGSLHAETPVVVVSEFKDDTGLSLNLGAQVQDAFRSILVNMPQVTVVERENMSAIVEEMQFSQSSLVDAGSAAEFGKKLGADLVAFGHVSNTDYRVESQKNIFTNQMQESGKGSALVTIQMVDVETNRTVFSQSSTGTASGNTDRNEMVQAAVNNAVANLSVHIQDYFPIRGIVIKTDQRGRDYLVYIDVGAEQGLAPGSKIDIFDRGEEVVHPVTGEVLSSSKGKRLATATINDAQDRFSIAKLRRKSEFEKMAVGLPFQAVPEKIGGSSDGSINLDLKSIGDLLR